MKCIIQLDEYGFANLPFTVITSSSRNFLIFVVIFSTCCSFYYQFLGAYCSPFFLSFESATSNQALAVKDS